MTHGVLRVFFVSGPKPRRPVEPIVDVAKVEWSSVSSSNLTDQVIEDGLARTAIRDGGYISTLSPIDDSTKTPAPSTAGSVKVGSESSDRDDSIANDSIAASSASSHASAPLRSAIRGSPSAGGSSSPPMQEDKELSFME